MNTSHVQDDELGASEVLWSPDLDARWRLLRRYISPFEKDRAAYHSSKYQKPVFVFMNPVAWHRLVEKQGAYRAVDLMLMLGFAPAPEGSSNIVEWIEREAAVTARVAVTAPTTTTTTGGGHFGSRRSFPGLPGVGEEIRANGGVRFWVLNHEDSRPSTSVSPLNQNASPRPTALSSRASSSALATMQTPMPLPSSMPATTTTTTTSTNAVVLVGARTETESAAVRIGNLEAEVKELTRQIRILKLRESDRDGSVVSDVASQQEPPQPHIIVRPDNPFVASTTCHSLVCLPVNYLDPDCAPYVVSLGASTGRTLLACTIVEHRYVIFLAPPHRRGSLAVVLLCTRDATLQPYARAVWLEYRPQDPPNTLTHHAVNQLLQEIPLPSSATAVDPNPSEVEQTKSESVFEDDNTFCDTDTALSTSDHGIDFEPRLPLTKEMLELIPNGVITGLRMGRTVAADQIHANNAALSVAGSECSLGGGERIRTAPAEMSWNDNDETKPDSTGMSTELPTSYQCGQQSGFSDEETTQHAFNCATNRTEISSSAATSVISFDSTTPSEMLATRQIVPSSVTHLACPFLLEDGRTVLLAAVASSLYVRLPVWETDSNGNVECVFTLTKDELHIGTVAVAIVPCAHQCFIVITQDREVLVGRYQANLPAPSNSWLANDLLHHNNAWIILYRGSLSGGGIVSHLVPNARLLFAVGVSGTVVQCSIMRGWRHIISIDIPSNTHDTFFCKKWVFDAPHSVGPYSCSVAPFRRDVVEQSDEELLTQCTVAELARRKRLQCLTSTAMSYVSPPVKVTLRYEVVDDSVLSLSLLPTAAHFRRHDGFVVVTSHSTLLSVCDVFQSSFCENLPETFSVSGSPYLVLSTPDYLLALSVVYGVHVLSALSFDPISRSLVPDLQRNCRVMRIARSPEQPFAGVVVQNGEMEEVLWLLCGGGFLTEVSIGALLLCNGVSTTLDAPGIQSGDCEDGEWVIPHITGLPRGFRAVSLVPFSRSSLSRFQPYAVTERYALLSDGVSDVYLVDLIERCVVGSLPSHGAMTFACDGPDMDLIVAYSKGMLQRLSPGVSSPARVHAAFSGVHQMYALPHMNNTYSTALIFYFLVTTAARTALFRGTMGQLEILQEAEEFVLDEPTLAVHSATEPTATTDKETTTSCLPVLLFAQCTPTCVNLEGSRIYFSRTLPGLSRVSHACFAGDKFMAIASCQLVVIFSIINKETLHVHLEERLSVDVSHLTSWRMRGSCRWAVAACLWSRRVVVWLLDVSATRRHELPIKDVVASSFPLPSGGVGLTFMNRTVAVMCNTTEEDVPTITKMVDVDSREFRAECCLPVTAHGAVATNHHFILLALYDGRVELVVLGSSGVVEEQLNVALSTPPPLGTANMNNSGVFGYMDAFRMIIIRCGFVLYLPVVSSYVLVLSDGSGITIWSLPGLLPPLVTSAAPCRRRGALLRSHVTYQVTHALQLPFITSYEYSLTRAAYLPITNTIVTLTDRGEETSLVSAIDAEAFLLIDGLPMAAREIPTCIESFPISGTDVVVIGTAVQSVDFVNDPTSGRLLVVHVRPLRISALACINTGGVLDISVQGFEDDYLIAVAGMGRVLVYRLTGPTLSLLCSTESKTSCTTVALRYPFLSCGLYLWGTHYMQLLPEGRFAGGTEEWETNTITTNTNLGDYGGDDVRGCSSGVSDSRLASRRGGECAPWSRWREATFTLKTCSLEPTAFANVHSQAVYGEGFARIDAERNIITVAFRDPPESVRDEVLETRVVGVEGGYSSILTCCFRLPSLPLQIRRTDKGRTPWRCRNTPFVSWCERSTALRLVGTTLLLPCADGSLHCAVEIPHAFVGPLLRLEQRITEMYDTMISLSRPNCVTGAGGLHRTYHSVSFEAEHAVQTTTRVLRKQSSLCVDAIEEYFFLTRLVEIPDPLLTEEERTLIIRKKQLMDGHLKHVWEEYAGELQDVDVGDMLHLW